MDARIIRELKEAVGADRLHESLEERLTYSYDATWAEEVPALVVSPLTAVETSAILRIANKEGLAVVPRGAGSGLSGGSVPQRESILLNMARMNAIIKIDPDDMIAVVQPGVINMSLQKAVAPYGLFYPPDPASWDMSTIGGNVAENAGGPRCLKYGVTKDYVLGLEVVLADGRIMHTGGRTIKDVAGYDLNRLLVGSEGTLGVFTEITLKLLPKPPASRTIAAVYEKIDQAAEAVGNVLKSGVLPLTTELIDGPCLQAVEAYLRQGLPVDADALLLIDLDGSEEEVKEQAPLVMEACRQAGARNVRVAKDAAEADNLWQSRRAISPALARLGDKLGEDLAVPRSRIPAMVRRIREIGDKYALKIPVFGHIGDGNLHPYIICDRRDKEMMERVKSAAAEILLTAIELGGTITGEHGVGLAKRDFIGRSLDAGAIEIMKKIKHDFDPNGILNPGKIF